MCKLIKKPIEYNDPAPSPNFEYHVYMAKEEEYDEIPEEVSRLFEHEENTIQPYKEPLETINLGSEEDSKEVKIGARLHPDVKSRLIELLKEYVDIFSWSYQDMPGLNTDIVEHYLPLNPECPPIKQWRTRPDMAVNIKEEVLKKIDVGFLVTPVYPQWISNIVPVPKKDGNLLKCVYL